MSMRILVAHLIAHFFNICFRWPVLPPPVQVSDAAATELRSANYLFGNVVQHTRGIKVAKDESKRGGLASATPAQAEQGKKVVKLMKAVALPKIIKDGWRAGLANSLVRFAPLRLWHFAAELA